MVTKNPHYILSPAGSKKKKVSAHGLRIIRAGLVEGLYLTPNNVGQKGPYGFKKCNFHKISSQIIIKAGATFASHDSLQKGDI